MAWRGDSNSAVPLAAVPRLTGSPEERMTGTGGTGAVGAQGGPSRHRPRHEFYAAFA